MKYLSERIIEWIGRSFVGCFFKGAPSRSLNAYLEMRESEATQNWVTVKRCGSIHGNRVTYMGESYVPCSSFANARVTPTRASRMWRSSLRNSELGRGAFGVAYAFVRAKRHETDKDAQEPPDTTPPEVVVVKVSRCPELSSARRECRNTANLCESDTIVPIVPSLPLSIKDEKESREPAIVYRASDGACTTVCVMAAYDCDMHRLLRDPYHRAVMIDAGEGGLLHIARNVLLALRYLRRRDLWYDDLKLANVLVDVASSALGRPHCVLGDVGGIYERDDEHMPPSTFPSPVSIVENRAVPGSMWALGVLLAEYAIEIHDLSHLRGLLYENLKHLPMLDRDQRFERAYRARTNMKMLSWAIPENWRTVKKMHQICCPEEAAYAFMNEEDSIDHMIALIDANL